MKKNYGIKDGGERTILRQKYNETVNHIIGKIRPNEYNFQREKKKKEKTPTKA